mgnify:CR=1 FL=1
MSQECNHGPECDPDRAKALRRLNVQGIQERLDEICEELRRYGSSLAKLSLPQVRKRK